VHLEHLTEWPGLDDLRCHPAALELNGARAHREAAAADFAESNHHRRRADDLGDADHGGMSERGTAGHAQGFERTQALLSGHGRDTERRQFIGQEDGRTLPQPVAARFSSIAVKGHDQNRWGGCHSGRLRIDACRREAGPRRDERERGGATPR
jgi:hypothetical protein